MTDADEAEVEYDESVQPVLLSRLDNGVRWVRLNRPDVRNALDDSLCDELARELERCAADDATRCVVLTGMGVSFCAGGDLGLIDTLQAARPHAESLPATLDRATRASLERVRSVQLLYDMQKPTIAVVNGAAVGGGLALALACDFRIAASDARLIVRFLELGLTTDYGLSYFVVALLGLAKAKELVMLQDEVTPDVALELGLVTSVVDRADLETAANALAARLAAGPGFAQAKTKLNLHQAAEGDLASVLRLEVLHTRLANLTDDAAEGVRALRERRQPAFKGA